MFAKQRKTNYKLITCTDINKFHYPDNLLHEINQPIIPAALKMRLNKLIIINKLRLNN